MLLESAGEAAKATADIAAELDRILGLEDVIDVTEPA